MLSARSDRRRRGVEFAAEGVVPVVSFRFYRAFVFPEQREHHRFVGGDDAVAVQQEQPYGNEQKSDHEHCRDLGDAAEGDHHYASGDEQQIDGEHEIAADRTEKFLGVARRFRAGFYCVSVHVLSSRFNDNSSRARLSIRAFAKNFRTRFVFKPLYIIIA